VGQGRKGEGVAEPRRARGRRTTKAIGRIQTCRPGGVGPYTLRNRIAHHEPIHRPTIAKTGRDIAGMHEALLDLLDWIDHDVHHWVTANSRVPALLQARPW
jgi:hypothetical protein